MFFNRIVSRVIWFQFVIHLGLFYVLSVAGAHCQYFDALDNFCSSLLCLGTCPRVFNGVMFSIFSLLQKVGVRLFCLIISSEIFHFDNYHCCICKGTENICTYRVLRGCTRAPLDPHLRRGSSRFPTFAHIYFGLQVSP